MLTDSALDQYCHRIGFTGALHANLSTLQQLHALHPQAIPFENLDAWLGREVRMQPDAVFDKLVMQQRGGYCFEHNQLFMRVLQSLGFEVHGLAARVLWNLPADIVLPRTHMLLLLEVDGQRCIADVGFGGLTMSAPLLLDDEQPQHSPHERFRLLAEGSGHYLLQAEIAGNWLPLYRFSMEYQTAQDYAMANWFVSTHPESRFVRQLIAGRVDSDGRHALLDQRYNRHYTGRDSKQQHLDSPAALRLLLEEQLHIETAGLESLDRRLESLFKAG